MIEQIVFDKSLEIKLLSLCPFRRKKPLLKPNFSDKVNIVAELKSKSPSYGNFNVDVSNLIGIYSKYAKAISVLTDSKYFGGSFEFLKEVSSKTHLPLLCKDFIIDKKQIDWAYACGADIILLIVRILSKQQLRALYNYAYGLGLEALVELHTEEDLDKLDFEPNIIGVNARDLDSLSINKENAKKLLNQLHNSIKIAESGIKERKDIEFFMPVASVFLIGETLLKSNNIEGTFGEFLCL